MYSWHYMYSLSNGMYSWHYMYSLSNGMYSWPLASYAQYSMDSQYRYC